MTTDKAMHPETNPDPITGSPGAHPVGVGIGAAAGGIAAGAAAGTFAAGPVGTVVGAAIGAVVGGLAGKGAAESMNPTQEVAADPESDLRLQTGARTDDGAIETDIGQRYSTARATMNVAGERTGSRLGEQSLASPTTPRANGGPHLPKSTEYPGSTASVADVVAVDTSEDAYWRAKYRNEPYYSSSRSFDDYAPAYRLAHQRRAQYGGTYEASEGQLASEWERAKGVSRLTWHEAKQAIRAAWNRLEGHTTSTDHWPTSHVGDSHSSLNVPPLSRGAFRGLPHDPVNFDADPVSTSTGHLSDAAHAAWDQTAIADEATYAATSSRSRRETVQAVREAVRSRPLAAIGIAMAVGFVLVGGPSLSRAISRARRS
jgi:hypothetical protein